MLRGHRVLFYDYRELLKEIQASYNPESQTTEMGVLEPVLKAEVWCWTIWEPASPRLWALETVGHILNTRYNEKRVTLLTTNFLDRRDSPRNAGELCLANPWPHARARGSEDRLRIASASASVPACTRCAAPSKYPPRTTAGRFAKRPLPR